MVLWEITLATAYFLGLRRTYRLALRIQRRVVGPRHPETRQFLHRCPSPLDFDVPIVLLSIVIFAERFAGRVAVVDLWKSLKILTYYKIKWTILMLPFVHSPTCVPMITPLDEMTKSFLIHTWNGWKSLRSHGSFHIWWIVALQQLDISVLCCKLHTHWKFQCKLNKNALQFHSDLHPYHVLSLSMKNTVIYPVC